MRSIGTMVLLGLLGLFALMATDAGTASATELCGATDCSTVYESGQVLESILGESTRSEFRAGVFGSVTCEESTVKGKTTAKSGTPLSGEVTSLTFGACKFSGTSCTVSAVHLPYSASIEETGEGDGTLKIKSSGSGDLGMKIVCGVLVNCTGTATEPSLEVEGGRTAFTRVSAVALQLSGSVCPKTVEWDAEYEAQAPQPMFVGKRSTILCKTAPSAGVCAKGETYTGKIEGSISAGVAIFEKTATESVQCGKAKLEAEYPKDAIGSIGSLTFEGSSEAACESTLPNKPKVPVTYTVEAGPSWFEWKPQGIWQGLMWFTPDLTAIKLQMEIEKVTCKYNANVKAPQLTSGVVANGSTGPTIVSLTNGFARETVNAKCPLTFVMRVTLALLRGPKENVYIAKEAAK